MSSRPSPLRRRSGVLLSALAACLAGSAAALTGSAAAKLPPGQPFVVRAIGDSVTAGFGYCGLHDPNCMDGPGQPYALSEQTVCRGGDYDNRCSSNKGDYTAHLPGTDGVPAISWAAQFAVREDIPDFINYAVTGSTPAQWDTDRPRGFFNFDVTMAEVLSAHPDLTLMTLGANPVLHQFYSSPLSIACVVLGTEALVRSCARRELANAGTEVHLEHVYERLLSVPSNHVIVLGYHTPHPAVHQKVLGKLVEFYLPKYNHVAAIIGVINSTVEAAVKAVEAKPGDGERIHFLSTAPWPAEQHQCIDTLHEPWVISWDFCIHPTEAGYRQFVDRLVSYLHRNPGAAGLKPEWVS